MEDYKQKATEKLEMLKKKGVDKRLLAQQVASTNIWIKREEIRIRKNQEGMDKGLRALERQKAHFYEEKVRLEKLKAEMSAEPIGVPKASGVGTGDDVLMEDSEKTLRDKELELRRMAAAKADANGEKFSAKRAQEISKLADGISESLKNENARETNRKRERRKLEKDYLPRLLAKTRSLGIWWGFRLVESARQAVDSLERNRAPTDGDAADERVGASETLRNKTCTDAHAPEAKRLLQGLPRQGQQEIDEERQLPASQEVSQTCQTVIQMAKDSLGKEVDERVLNHCIPFTMASRRCGQADTFHHTRTTTG